MLGQQKADIEYIIIDGNSSDATLSVIKKYQQQLAVFISEKDKGIYDAMNKGIRAATGDIIGILNADDFFPDSGILQQVVQKFEESQADIVYGNLWYVNRDDTRQVVRKWHAGNYKHGSFQWGWMPPHPTFYAKRQLFENYGEYRPQYGSAADYELMARFLHKHRAGAAYLPEVLVKMRTGGVSNSSLRNRLNASKNDLRAMRDNGISFPELAIFLKPLRKLPQFFRPGSPSCMQKHTSFKCLF